MSAQTLKRATRITTLLGSLLFLLMTSASAVQVDMFTLTHNNWTYRERGIWAPNLADRNQLRAGRNAGLADFVDPKGVDHFHQDWWWFGIGSGMNRSREFALVSQTDFTMPNGRTAMLTYEEGLLRFALVYVLTGINATQARLDITWGIRNTGLLPVDTHFYAYFDPDLDGTARNDEARLTRANNMQGRFETMVTDVDNPGVTSVISGAYLSDPTMRNFQSNVELTRADSMATDPTLTLLANMAADDLRNIVRTNTPGDVTGGYQWSFRLDVNDIVAGTLTKNITLQQIPEPSSVILFGSGIITLWGYAWQRRKKVPQSRMALP